MAELTNLRATARRHSTPGSLIILLLAAIAFGPRALDVARGEPWISNSLMLAQTSAGVLVVEDTTLTTSPVHGLRVTWAEAGDGSVICTADHAAAWHGEAKQFWRLAAFIGCERPAEAFRVCSRFSLVSESGRRRPYGPFCSPVSQPPVPVAATE